VLISLHELVVCVQGGGGIIEPEKRRHGPHQFFFLECIFRLRGAEILLFSAKDFIFFLKPLNKDNSKNCIIVSTDDKLSYLSKLLMHATSGYHITEKPGLGQPLITSFIISKTSLLLSLDRK